MDIRADLRAGADRRPRVDHRPRADPRADVHVARHQHDALGQEGAVTRDARRHDADAEGRVDALERDLVEEAEAADLHRLDLPEAEVEEDRLLRPLVHDPAVGAGLGDPHLAAVEEVDRLLDGLCLELAGFPHLLDSLREPSQHILQHRDRPTHSSSVGTSA